jgi:hypothetical protein
MTTLTTEAGPFTCRCLKPITREAPANGWRDEDGDQYCHNGEQHAPATEADLFPLACGWCENGPVTHLAVIDVKAEGKPDAERGEYKLCTVCAHGITILPASWTAFWLYELVPDHCEGN